MRFGPKRSTISFRPNGWKVNRYHYLIRSVVLAGLLAAAGRLRVDAAGFATGADASWYTQMVHDAAYVFRTQQGQPLPCLNVLQSVGVNAVRLRVWLNPAGGWCGQSDVVAKALAAQALGQRVMLDFHFSDTWASGSNQAPPAAWASDDLVHLESDVAGEVNAVLSAIKAAGGDVAWVQLGNEINEGMLFPIGKVNANDSTSFGNLASLLNAGYSAVKAVYPSAVVIVHLSNGENDAYFRQFLDALRLSGGKFDAVGLSAYPYWANLSWQDEVTQVTKTLSDIPARYGVPAMVCECGYAESDPLNAGSYLQALIAAAQKAGALGVFYWEPECYGPWPAGGAYAMGAFTANGQPSTAMNAFANSGVAPYFAQAPAAMTVEQGSTFVLNAGASGFPVPSLQWYHDGVPVPGATGQRLLVTNTQATDAGSYWCSATNSVGEQTSTPVTVEVIQAANPGRLINVSCLVGAGGANGLVTVGFVVRGPGGSAGLPVLIRASGPALSAFGVPGVLADPSLTLNLTSVSPSKIIDFDSGWKADPAIAAAAKAVGAFSWGSTATADSALFEAGLATGNYTAQVTGASGDGGETLVEVYDGTPRASMGVGSPRLINLSVLANVQTGMVPVTAGFVVAGSTVETVLIRASGPALKPYLSTGLLADPELIVTDVTSQSGRFVAANAGWSADPQIASVAKSVGAFSWGTEATNDSALVLTLPPGNYTAAVSGEAGDSGSALVEVYEVLP